METFVTQFLGTLLIPVNPGPTAPEVTAAGSGYGGSCQRGRHPHDEEGHANLPRWLAAVGEQRREAVRWSGCGGGHGQRRGAGQRRERARVRGGEARPG